MDDTPVLSFGEQNFGTAKLGNRSRTRRLVRLADQILEHPQGSLPDKLPRPKDLKAFYRLMTNPRVTHRSVLAPHQELTRARMARDGGTILLLHDGTELNYSGLHSVAGLGHIAGGKARGLLCHNSLAVAADGRRVLGLVNQILHRRPRVPKGESREDKRDREDRESLLWLHACEAIGPAPTGQLHVDVCDRGADLFEFLESEHRLGRSYVVRATHDRAVEVVDPATREVLGTDDPVGRLFGLAASLPEWTRKTVRVSARGGHPEREALVRMAAAPVLLQAPRRARGSHGQEPLAVWVVCVREIDPPAGREPVEWVLLTNVPVATVADLVKRVEWYETRWVVEELHKGQKTGCSIEDLQLGKQNHDERGKPAMKDRLGPAIALLSVVAVQLLTLRDLGRDAKKGEGPATEWFSRQEQEVLAGWQYGDSRREMTLAEFCRALAMLGGHQGRKGDGPPGWLTLWRGWQKMQLMVQGVLGAQTGGQKPASREASDGPPSG
jgi:hypothetical protein